MVSEYMNIEDVVAMVLKAVALRPRLTYVLLQPSDTGDFRED